MKTLPLFLFLLFIAVGGYAQDTLIVKNTQDTIVVKKDSNTVKQPVKESKFYYGGFLNLTFGSYTAIGIEPLVGYKITSKLSAGTIVTYEYISDNTNTGYTYKSSNFGASIFTRYRVIPQAYFHVEFSEMNYNSHNSNGYNTNYWVPFLFLGPGFSQQISQNSWMNTQILFDVIQNENSPYGHGVPFYSIGFGIGF